MPGSVPECFRPLVCQMWHLYIFIDLGFWSLGVLKHSIMFYPRRTRDALDLTGAGHKRSSRGWRCFALGFGGSHYDLNLCPSSGGMPKRSFLPLWLHQAMPSTSFSLDPPPIGKTGSWSLWKGEAFFPITELGGEIMEGASHFEASLWICQ
jgi:hypothetical protein